MGNWLKQRVLKSDQEANEEIVSIPITTETEGKRAGEVTVWQLERCC